MVKLVLLLGEIIALPGRTTLALTSCRGTVSSDSRNLRGVVIGCYMGTSEHTLTEKIAPIKGLF